MIPQQVQAWMEENGCGTLLSARPVGGGCINNGTRLVTQNGGSFFLKTNLQAPPDMFAREAEGLRALRIEGGPRLPEAYLVGPDFLLMEDLQPAPRRSGYWQDFGRELATLHSNTSPRFGFDHDNYIGSTPQPNPWTKDGFVFFAQSRLSFQAQLAGRRGVLSAREVAQVEHLAQRLLELLPNQPASLIHGDLWSGNATTDTGGGPALIDPAAHYGWAEAELAMTTLFGTFPHIFYQAYTEVRPLDPGYWERFPIYNLYHLLNHLNLFGAGYHAEVLAIVRRY